MLCPTFLIVSGEWKRYNQTHKLESDYTQTGLQDYAFETLVFRNVRGQIHSEILVISTLMGREKVRFVGESDGTEGGSDRTDEETGLDALGK